LGGKSVRRSNKGIIITGTIAIIIIVLFIFSFSFSKSSDQDLYLRKVKEVEAVNSKMIETDFHVQLLSALKNEGYKPTGSIAYTIFSMDKKEMTIILHGLDSSKKQAEKYIQELSNQLSNSIGLGTFEVSIIED
jgi:ABC-type phosphate/phosphonate transport system permease subunit